MFTEPNIIKYGLVIYLDETKVKSYSSSRNTWNDLMGNHSYGTLTNEPTYNYVSKGRIAFDGVNDCVNFGNLLISVGEKQ